jgi:hypothetical protein
VGYLDKPIISTGGQFLLSPGDQFRVSLDNNRNNNLGFRVARTPLISRSRGVYGRFGRARRASRTGHDERERPASVLTLAVTVAGQAR